MIIFQTIIFILFIVIFWVWWSRRSFRALANKIPGSDGLPLLGFAQKFVGIAAVGECILHSNQNESNFFIFPDFLNVLMSITEAYKSEPLVKIWYGPLLYVSCFNPEDAKIVLNSPRFLKKPRIVYSSLAKFALLTISGEEYKVHRKAITPLFTPKSLKNFLPLINQVANEFLVEFDENLTGKYFDISFNTLDFALNSILRTFFNIDEISKESRMKLLDHLAA
jgi:hypothetical protein